MCVSLKEQDENLILAAALASGFETPGFYPCPFCPVDKDWILFPDQALLGHIREAHPSEL